MVFATRLNVTMSIERAEELKREFTDKYVVVRSDVPELKRFQGLTGKVKTVNMNCRALVEFDGAVDISWYDIDPSYLTVVETPLPKKKSAEPKAEKQAAPPKSTGAAKPAAGMSPLELARQQAAGGTAKSAAENKAGLSPLEKARQQGAAGSPPADGGAKKLSPLEQARQQGAAGAAAPDEAPVVESSATETPAAQESTAPAETSPPPTDGKQLSPLELARQQGAAKRD